MKRQPKKRILAAFLAAVLLLGKTLPAMAVTNDKEPPCKSHQQHDADCGYAAALPCGYAEHTVDCYTDELICGLDGDAVQTATDSEADTPHEHIQECYALNCPHERGAHDDACGYAAALPCTHECELCAPKDKVNGGEADREDGLDHSETPPDTSGQNIQKSTPSDAVPAMLGTPVLISTIDGDGYSFDSDSGTLTISSVEGTTAWREKASGIIAYNVTSVVVQSGVTEIGNAAFYNCLRLEQASLPDSLKKIGNLAFGNCNKLVLTSLPDSVTSIGESAFLNCGMIELTSLPDGISSIEEFTFSDCRNLALTSLPNNVTSIEASAFWGCSNLALTSLPTNLTSIGTLAFSNCNKLALTSLPASLTSIGTAAFSSCTGLKTLDLSACTSLTFIESEAFLKCSELKLNEIPASVTAIGREAFYGCSSLTSLTFPHSTAPVLGYGVFNEIPDLTIYIPYGAGGYTAENNWPMDKIVINPGKSVTIQAVPGVTAPALGATPVTKITDTEQYTGMVVWNPDHNTFAAATEYTATITLAPKPGYTLQGVMANFFQVAGATSVSNAENSGVIQAVFPKTGGLTFTISADKTSLNFVSLPAGYTTAPAAQTVAITNTGNQPVTLNQPAAISYEIGTLSKTELPVGETATFTVRPKPGLAKNTYSETITVSNTQGSSVSIALSFTVTDKPTYDVIVSGGTGGGSYEEGAAVTITAAVPRDKRFTVWTITPDVAFTSGGTNTKTATFTMPAGAVTATANFENRLSSSGGDGSSGSSYYFRTLADEASGVNVEGSQIHENAVLTVKARGFHNIGDAGCDLLRAADKAGRALSLYDVSLSRVFLGSVTVSIPVEGRDGQTLTVAHCIGGKLVLSNVTVKNGMAAVTADKLSPFAVLDGVYTLDTLAAPAAGNPFSDVKESDWYYNAVLYAYQNGLMNGTMATTFDPLGAVTRAQLPVALYRLEGSPAVTAQNPFADVRSGLWYANGITWAAGAGLVDGYNATTYAPGDAVTREQFAVTLWRYAKYKGWDVSMGEDTNILSYADAFDVSEWAIPALQWACGAGIMTGTTDNRLAPKAQVTRAELARMLQLLME